MSIASSGLLSLGNPRRMRTPADPAGSLCRRDYADAERRLTRSEAIKFRMEQQGLSKADLQPFIGASGRVSEVLSRKRPLSLRMVKRLHEGLRIPYESLLAGVR